MKRFGAGKHFALYGYGKSLGVLCTLFLTGGLIGCFFVRLLDMSELQALRDFLSDYFSLICNELVPRSFWPTVRSRLWEFFVLVLVGMSWVGIVVFPLYFSVQGFLFSFSLGCLCRAYGITALLPGSVLFLMPAILWAPAVFWLGTYGFERSFLRLRGELQEEKAASCVGLSVCCGLFILCVAVDWFIVPVLLRVAARILL